MDIFGLVMLELYALRKVRIVPEFPEDMDGVINMRNTLEDIFARRPGLMEKLMATKDTEIVWNNTEGDTFWGVCDGEGHNWLGKILMDIRFDEAIPPRSELLKLYDAWLRDAWLKK